MNSHTAHQDAAPPFLTNEPPHWAARGLSYLLILLFCTLVTATILVKVPETISAPFVLAARVGADPVRALRRGIIQQVNLAEGQSVKQGERLFVIRSEQTNDQSAELRGLEMQLRTTAESLSIANDKFRNQQLAAEEERRRLQGQIEHFAQLIELKNGELALANEVAESYAKLRNEGLAGATVVKEKQTEVSRLNGQIETLRNDQRDTRAALEKISRDEELQRNEYRERERQLKAELDQSKMLIASRSQWVAQNQGDQFVTTAPCTGTILRLHVKSSATVVAEGEMLCELSCNSERLQAELKIPPIGVGRVNVGQGVKFLYDAFPYQQYGVKFGQLRWITPTSTTTEFRAIADIADESVAVLGQPAALKAGMGGRAEIVIAQRSLISIAFDPIRQLRENMRMPPASKVAQ